MACGKPFNPSTQAMNISSTPRVFKSLSTLSRNLAPSLALVHNPSTSLWPSMVIPMATWTARFCTVPSSRILTTRASRYTIGYTASSGRFCQARTSSSTASVTLEMRVGLTSTPYISSRCPWMSRVVMPRAYIDRILPSKPAMRVWPFGMIWGSNVASRSRGVMTSISPNSPFKVFLLFPLRRLPFGFASWSCFSYPRWVAISDSSARSIRALVNCLTHITAFIERHGYALLFFWVLAEQGAIPLPSIPLLVTAGALVRLGRLQMLVAIACCVGAALVADTVWFQLGRRRGHWVLHFLCRVALEPDSCVRRTENAFLKYGLNSLLVSKFVPGLNAVVAPLAGS